MSRIAGSLALVVIALAGCAGSAPPRLTPVGDVIPAGVSFAGRWHLRADGDDSERRIREAEHKSGGGLDDVVAPSRRERNRSRRGADGPSVYVFLRTGSRLKITQTLHGLFISFDRSVVEEYRFREHRLVNVGPIEADRVSGWVDGSYVIQTLDGEGALLEEAYMLETSDDVMVRTVSIVHDKQEVLSLRQVYDRVE